MKKLLALLTSAVLLVGCLTGCIDKNKEAVASETSITRAEIIEDSSYSDDVFGENYDPLDEDYNPYADKNDKEKKSEEVSQTEIEESEPAKSTEETDETSPAKTISGSTSNSTSNKSDKDVTLNIKNSNSWENGSDKFTQLDGTIKNKSKSDISGWTAVIKVSSGVKVDQKWNCEISVNGDTLTVKPVEHNSTVASGGEGTFGMILCNAGKISASDSYIEYDNKKTTATSSGNSNNTNNNSNNKNTTKNVGNSNPKIVQAKDVPAPTTDDWLYVKGNKIVDKDGKQVWLTGVNWFGYNTGTNTFDGLWNSDLNTSIDAIADRGFNLLRIPISAELILDWSNGSYPTANFNQATNSYLVEMNSLEIFDYVVGQCRANGIKIMIDIHSAETNASGHMINMWYAGSVSEKNYIDALAWMSDRYKNDDTIIAYDLKNEPHGKASESPRAKWDNSKDPDNWKYIAEKAANAVLKKNPNVLIMVEGIEIYPIDIKKNGNFTSQNMSDYYTTWWGGNLRGVKDNPINLGKYQNKLVYSPHDYGPTVYKQPWFEGNYTYDSLMKDCWNDNWFYIYKDKTAPVLIGEWGCYMTEPNITWMTHMRKLIKTNKLHHTFWCFNANSGDTGGLVLDDFKTWDEEKYAFVKEVLWQQNGKFVGLDHKIPLGDNGITLEEAK